MNRPAQIFSATVRNLQAAWWRYKQADFLVIVNWHQITPVFDPNRHNRNIWTRLSDFEKEVDYLASEFQILPLDEALDRLKRKSLYGPCVSLSFDDGDQSVAEFVLPSLRERKLPATFFVNTAYLDGSRSCWVPILAYLRNNREAFHAGFPAELEEKALQLRQTNDAKLYDEVRLRVERLASLVPDLESRRVSWQWLSKLDGDQFAIGAHGHEHQRYSMMPADWQRNDLEENVRRLSRFKAYRPVFAVPFGRASDWTRETMAIARGLGLDVVVADGGVNVSAGSFYHRIPCDSGRVRSLIAEAMVSRSRNGAFHPLNNGLAGNGHSV